MPGRPDREAELRPSAPIRRPPTARARGDDAIMAPLTEGEQQTIERHIASLPVHAGGRVWEEPALGVLLVDMGPSHGGLHHAAVVRWPDRGWRANLRAVRERALVDGVWPTLLIAEGLTRPADLPARLASLGWSESGRETALFARHPAAVPHLDPQLRLEAVTAQSAPAYEELERSIFRLPGRDAAVRVEGLAAGIADGTLRGFMVRSGGRVVAVARLSLLGGSAGLYGIGVTAERRREGLGSFVTAVGMRAALARGGGPVWLSVEDGNVAAHQLYERLGFRPAFRWSRWLAPPR